jgi:hypothetical protein
MTPMCDLFKQLVKVKRNGLCGLSRFGIAVAWLELGCNARDMDLLVTPSCSGYFRDQKTYSTIILEVLFVTSSSI